MTQPTLPSRRRAEKKNCFPVTVNIRDVVKFYRKTYGTPTKGGCASKVVRAVLNEFNAYVAEQLIKGDRMVLPYNLGCLDVIKKKQQYVIKDGALKTKNLLVDWEHTWEYWKKNPIAAEQKKLLYYTNDHTDSYRYKFRWDKYGCQSVNVYLYSFKPSRLLSRKLADYLQDPDTIKNYAEKC